jgi:hypothetical protein
MTWGGWTPSGWVPWGKSLWGTTIDYGQAAKLVIDKDGVGHFTDASGETATWDTEYLAWIEPDGTFAGPQFGVPGMDWTAEQAEAAIDQLTHASDALMSENPNKAAALDERARDLWDTWHPDEPYPY